MDNKSSFDRWIFDSYPVTKEGIGILRIIMSLFILFFLIPGNGSTHFEFISGMPKEFYAPPVGPFMLFNGFPSLLFFETARAILILALIAMLVGWKTTVASITVGISVLLLQGFIYSIGKVNHEVLIGVIPIVMAGSGWGAAYSVDSLRKNKRVNSEGWPLTLISLLIAFMMFTAGFTKIMGGWLDPSSQATQGHLINQFFVRGRQDLLSPIAIHINSSFFWELLDWATVFLEIGFLVTVLRPIIFKWFLGLAVIFHFSIMIILNIAFLPNFLAYAIFLNWSGVHQKMVRCLFVSGRKEKWALPALLIAGCGIFFGVLKWISTKNLFLLNSDLVFYEVVIVSLAVVFGIIIVTKQLRQNYR